MRTTLVISGVYSDEAVMDLFWPLFFNPTMSCVR